VAKKRKIVDPLSPLDAITSFLATVIITIFALFAVAGVAGEHISVFDVGDGSVCTSARFSPPGDSQALDKPDRQMFGLRDGVEAHSAATEICQSGPSVWQNALAALSNAPSLIVFVGFLLMTRRTIRFARRDGLFSARLAGRIERLGWFLLLGLLAGAAAEWLGDGLLKASMSSMGWASGEVHISIAGVVGAYGIISIGRVMARAAVLQADADTTI
jgi:hypothetical protein